jgi:hypothetical protein
MTYPNVDLQSLPFLELEVGTDPVERALQLSHAQVWAALLAIDNIYNGGSTAQYPERIVGSTEQTNFDTYVDAIRTALVTASTNYKLIFAQ